jgi:RNA recognition motif-containing protein
MKLYIGNLPYSTTEEDLKRLFAKFKSLVGVQLIVDRATDRSKGFAFVELSSDDEGRAAIEEFNESELDGRSIIVNEARPQEKKERRPFNGSGNRKGPRY